MKLDDLIPFPLAETTAFISLARVEYVEGPGETYALPIVPAPAEAAPSTGTPAIVIHILKADVSEEIRFVDALSNSEFLSRFLHFMQEGSSLAGTCGELEPITEPALLNLKIGHASQLVPRLLKAEQSNTSVIYGDQLILKFFRRFEEGINPDLEMGHFLTETAHYSNIPPLYGSVNYKSAQGNSMALGILQGFVPNRGDAWRFFTESLAQLMLAASKMEHSGLSAVSSSRPATFPDSLPQNISAQLSNQLDLVGLLGKRTGELHSALALSRGDSAFDPEPFTPEFREVLEKSFHDLAVRNFDLLRQKLPELPVTTSELAKKILKLEDDVLLVCHSCLEGKIACVRTRIHGDYHLGQVLFTGADFFIIDFEGEPAKPLSERRYKRSPIQDVAGMLRSFHYAVRSALLAARNELALSPKAERAVEQLGKNWQTLASRRFLDEYGEASNANPVLRNAPQEFDRLLQLHLLEKAVYELGYELNNRPAWLPIPLGGIEETLVAMK